MRRLHAGDPRGATPGAATTAAKGAADSGFDAAAAGAAGAAAGAVDAHADAAGDADACDVDAGAGTRGAVALGADTGSPRRAREPRAAAGATRGSRLAARAAGFGGVTVPVPPRRARSSRRPL